NEVRKLQQILKDLGFFTYPYITGYYGLVTTQAVKDFQKFYQLPITGKVDQSVLNKLNEL
ncbi:peptidoglycan-binding protein, partial [Patescibacteria group bacterium]|nr:peptidoglycan-binding protein [Patescibacteria group bacterium]